MEIADKERKNPGLMTLVNLPKITEERSELAAALSAAQAEIEAAPKTENNPFFKSKYADLSTVRAAIREAFGKHGLSVVQIPHTSGGEVNVTTLLMHKSGQFIEGTLALKPVKNDPQGIGSAITYARRYALMAFAGVAPDDDDGNAASGKEQDKKKNDTNRTQDRPKQEVNYWQSLKSTLAKIGVEDGDKDTADAVVRYCTRHHSGGMVNLSMAHKQPACCQRAVECVVDAWREFPKENELLAIVNEFVQEESKKGL